MTLDVEAVAPDEVPGDVAAVGVPAVSDPAGPRVLGALPATVGPVIVPTGLDASWCKRQGFTAGVGQQLVLRSAHGGPITVLLGLGSAETVGADQWRRAGAALIRSAGEGGVAAVAVPAELSEDECSSLAEGAGMAAYRFGGYRSSETGSTVDRVLIAGEAVDTLATGAARGRRIADAVCTARDLVNTPPSDLTPDRLAARATEMLAACPGVTVEVWDEERIAAERMGALLGVSRGSTQPPRFVRADYEPPDPLELDGRVPHVVLVGKGITFDSGGLSLKTADGMVTMKTDMSGAACVLSTLAAVSDLGARVKVTALAPVTENMPGGGAMKPGDVLTTRRGLTIEVLNTDAEGRLVLADALSLAAELEPDAIIDVATLTGAATSALGTSVAALFGNRDRLVHQLRTAGTRAGEPLWHLPMPEEYRDHIDSDVADMKNIGRPGQAGAIVAAMLLARFVGDVPWAHLDIAGTGRSSESTGYLTKGGTAFGVRTLIDLLRTYGEE